MRTFDLGSRGAVIAHNIEHGEWEGMGRVGRDVLGLFGRLGSCVAFHFLQMCSVLHGDI